MNKFNQRQRNTVKERKKKARATKKRNGAAQKHKDLQVKVSGKRTGKAQKKVARQQRLQLKQAVEKGLIDLEMQDAETSETNSAEAV